MLTRKKVNRIVAEFTKLTLDQLQDLFHEYYTIYEQKFNENNYQAAWAFEIALAASSAISYYLDTTGRFA